MPSHNKIKLGLTHKFKRAATYSLCNKISLNLCLSAPLCTLYCFRGILLACLFLLPGLRRALQPLGFITLEFCILHDSHSIKFVPCTFNDGCLPYYSVSIIGCPYICCLLWFRPSHLQRTCQAISISLLLCLQLGSSLYSPIFS